ncbi:putative integral membrane protein [Rhodopseudomonas rhenobacensis]|uniref:Putative integral membrane protein n=1 Tax=Rhodopseudomonas rhenobacensis TaxID=87461 RepID=A0A7W8E0Y2_9BRAD|nr:LapA family protein [Rhodopseudomonas rhenobacensis]MBB5049325.1 putative integral membrane protein [Rhodopseudomonas rhenobacensis]
MQKFLTALVLIPLGLIIFVFALANRQLVTVSLDPFAGNDPELAATLPLFVLLIGVAILGVIAGSTVTWLRQRRWRKAARRHQAEAIEARAQLTELRASVVTPPAAEAQRAPRLLQLGSANSSRDKQSATL